MTIQARTYVERPRLTDPVWTTHLHRSHDTYHQGSFRAFSPVGEVGRGACVSIALPRHFHALQRPEESGGDGDTPTAPILNSRLCCCRRKYGVVGYQPHTLGEVSGFYRISTSDEVRQTHSVCKVTALPTRCWTMNYEQRNGMTELCK